ncbi:hypothetical protein VN97_g7309 [Penicillium thymicola]|uniref:Uncharacterized protein n=1 Tax=Penicillium thymicola TaxID=293382 RepID=A0AAI9X6Z4_PENTH|nr:hypothetical protein VN97_g7309 [Penicillium thymicola]
MEKDKLRLMYNVVTKTFQGSSKALYAPGLDIKSPEIQVQTSGPTGRKKKKKKKKKKRPPKTLFRWLCGPGP